MGIRAILLRARTRACAWAAVWAVLLSMVQTAPANVRLDLADLPPENRVGGFSETFENRAGQNVAFVQYPRLENEPILAMTASGRLFWLSRDPLGERADSLHNLYRFCNNNPLNVFDPVGLEDLTWDEAMGWGEVGAMAASQENTKRERGKRMMDGLSDIGVAAAESVLVGTMVLDGAGALGGLGRSAEVREIGYSAE